MPAGRYPASSGAHNGQVIHVQRGNGCATAWCQADDLAIALVPAEMLDPFLAKRVKQSNDFSGNGIGTVFLCAFVNIA